MGVEFTAHNIRLDDGSFTRPDMTYSMEADPVLLSARRLLEAVFPGDKDRFRLVDLGCLEGGYSVEFARMGFNVLGVEVRETNIAACNFVKSKVNLPHLTFVRDDAWNVARYGMFDVAFCCGLLYHLDRPRQFLETLSSVTKRLLILQTHFSTDTGDMDSRLPAWVQNTLVRIRKNPTGRFTYGLSGVSENEGLAGRWYTEYADDKSFAKREAYRWAAWGNRRSFWIQREYLLQAIYDVGFDLVMEQFDHLGPDIADRMLRGDYHVYDRGIFVGIRS